MTNITDLNGTKTNGTPLEVIIIKSIVLIVISITAVIGNTLVIMVICQRNAGQTVTNYLIINLAIIDIITGLFRLPLYVMNIIADRQYYDAVGCNIHSFIGGICFIGSVHSLMWIAIIRYLVVVKSKKWRIKPKHAYYYIAIIWLSCIIVSSWSLLGWSKNVYIDVEKGCIPSWYGSGISGIVKGILEANIDFAIPLVIICFCYLLIFLYLKRNQRRIAHRSFRMPGVVDKTKVTLTMFIVFVGFLICYSTWSLLVFIVIPIARVEVPDALYFTASALVFCNSCINPILYGYLSKNFRKGYKRALRKIFKCDHKVNVESISIVEGNANLIEGK